jgi:hypothetical protein
MSSAREPLHGYRHGPRFHLERCWRQECDIDPMILRMRLLRHLGSLPQARSLEQELLPIL